MAEYLYFDGESFITFNIVYATENEVQLAITNRGRITVTTYDLYRRKSVSTKERNGFCKQNQTITDISNVKRSSSRLKSGLGFFVAVLQEFHACSAGSYAIKDFT